MPYQRKIVLFTAFLLFIIVHAWSPAAMAVDRNTIPGEVHSQGYHFWDLPIFDGLVANSQRLPLPVLDQANIVQGDKGWVFHQSDGQIDFIFGVTSTRFSVATGDFRFQVSRRVQDGFLSPMMRLQAYSEEQDEIMTKLEISGKSEWDFSNSDIEFTRSTDGKVFRFSMERGEMPCTCGGVTHAQYLVHMGEVSFLLSVEKMAGLIPVARFIFPVELRDGSSGVLSVATIAGSDKNPIKISPSLSVEDYFEDHYHLTDAAKQHHRGTNMRAYAPKNDGSMMIPHR